MLIDLFINNVSTFAKNKCNYKLARLFHTYKFTYYSQVKLNRNTIMSQRSM